MESGASNPIAPHEVLQVMERFQSKCLGGKKITHDEIHEFYQTIVQSTKPASKTSSLTASTESNAQLNTKILTAIQKLKISLGQNKAVIEAASATISYPLIEKALTSLELYLKKEGQEGRKVSRKGETHFQKGG